MAKQFGSQIDLQKIPVVGLVPESGSEPSSPAQGQLWVDGGILKVREGAAWLLVANVAGGSTPTGPAGGDLAGTYPNPTIGLDKVVTDRILNANVTYAKLAADTKDQAAGTSSMRTLGTGGTQAAAGNDSRFTDSRNPTGSAGGDLTGSTYPNPTIATLAVTAAKIANATITDVQVAAANKDGVVGTASMRTLGTGAQQALAGNTRLDQITAPTASVNLNNQKVIGLGPPTLDTDAATKLYADTVSQGLDAKASVRAATTTNITLSGAQTIDGVSVVATDRVLVKDQSTPNQNGIYVAAAGAWARATDMDAWAEVPAAFVFVEQGTANADSGWVSTADAGGTLGTTNITWVQFSGAGQVNAGTGLTKTGNTIDAIGTTNRITVAADSIDISTSYVGQASINTLGTITTGTWTGTTIAVLNGGTGATTAAQARTNLGATTKYSATLGALTAGVRLTITHNLGTTDVIAAFKIVASNKDVVLDWETIDANSIGVTADTAVYTANTLRVTVIG